MATKTKKTNVTTVTKRRRRGVVERITDAFVKLRAMFDQAGIVDDREPGDGMGAEWAAYRASQCLENSRAEWEALVASGWSPTKARRGGLSVGDLVRVKADVAKRMELREPWAGNLAVARIVDGYVYVQPGAPLGDGVAGITIPLRRREIEAVTP